MSQIDAISKIVAGDVPYGVAVSFAGEVGDLSRDSGVEWLFWAADPDITTDRLRVRMLGSKGGARGMVGSKVSEHVVEAAVERQLARKFPQQSRLACMLARCEDVGYLELTGDDLRNAEAEIASPPNAFTT